MIRYLGFQTLESVKNLQISRKVKFFESPFLSLSQGSKFLNFIILLFDIKFPYPPPSQEWRTRTERKFPSMCVYVELRLCTYPSIKLNAHVTTDDIHRRGVG